MATFYKYQERDIDSQVNWADIGLGMSDMITDQVATRKAKKEAYDDEVRAFNQYLDEHPTGDDDNLTTWTSAYSSDMQKKMLENQRAFKNGMISERDNVVFTQNVKNGTSTIFNLATEYQAEYKDKMARMNSTDPLNKSQEAETWLMSQAESYDNYKTSKPIIDPKTGLVLMSMKKADGTYETVSAANLSNRIKAKYDYFDSDGTTTLIESKLGKEIVSKYDEAKSRLKTGLITEEEFKPLKEGFDKALKARIDSYLVQPTNVSSILTNDLLFDAQGNSVDYSFTYDKAEAAADPFKILMVVKGGGDGMPMPDFTTENGKRQIEAAQEYMTVQTIEKIDRKVSKQVVGALGDAPQQQEWQFRARQQGISDKKYKEDVANNLAKLYGGTAEEIQAALPWFKANDPTITNVTRQNGLVTVYRKQVDSKGVEVPGSKPVEDKYLFKVKGNPVPFKDWVQGAALGLTGISNINDALGATGTYKNFRNQGIKSGGVDNELTFSTNQNVSVGVKPKVSGTNNPSNKAP